jgi:anti-sigma factor RsiW
MAHQESTEQDRLHEELTSYLDGELDAAEVRAVEDRLARDPAYRAELQRLQRAWDMLDRLPRASLPESFSRTTLEMVALAASQEAQEALDELPARQRRLRVWGWTGAAAAAIVGFVIGRALWTDPNEQLLRDLPVLQNYDLYYQADNIDFLRQLDQAGLFDEKEADHGR